MATSAIASATATDSQNYGNRMTPEATQFFIIACSILGVFVISTGCCCISLRYRKHRMQRIVTAAFDQGVFQHAEVGERVNTLRRQASIIQVKAVVERPQLYEVWRNEHAEWPAISDPVTRVLQPPVHWPEYNPVSASVSDPNAIDSRLSDLPIDTQLAYLFHAKVQLKREWKQRPRSRGSVPPYILKHGQKPSSLHPPPPERPLLRLSVLIAMPALPIPLNTPATSEDLVLGVALAPFGDIHVDDGGTNHKTDTFGTKPSSA